MNTLTIIWLNYKANKELKTKQRQERKRPKIYIQFNAVYEAEHGRDFIKIPLFDLISNFFSIEDLIKFLNKKYKHHYFFTATTFSPYYKYLYIYWGNRTKESFKLEAEEEIKKEDVFNA